MDRLKELTKVFDDIGVTEEQENAIREFFSLFAENVKEKVSSELQEQIESLNEEIEELKNGSGETSLADAERAFNAFQEDAEKAFELFKEEAEKAFELFKQDAEKAAELMLEDVKEEHAKQLAEAIDKLYEDIDARVHEDFKSSKEFAALKNVVRAVSAVVSTDDTKSLLEEIEALRKENEELKNNNVDLSKKEIIASLVEGFSDEHKRTMIEFLEGAKSEEEIYERFNAIASIIEGETTAGETPKKNKFKRKKVEEVKEKTKEVTEEGETLLGSETKEQTIVTEDEDATLHSKIMGSNIPGLNKLQQQGLAFLLHARQAR